MRRKAVLLMGSLLLFTVFMEVGARAIQHWHWLRPSVTDVPPPPPSSFEITGSLSQITELRPLAFPATSYRVAEESRFNYEGGVWLPHRNEKTQVKMVNQQSGQVVREIRVTTDAHARRVPSWQRARAQTAKLHMVFFGCSITWGYGVNDDETYPALISQDSENLITYNLAAGGYGLGELLTRAQMGDSLEDIQPKTGIGIYAMFEGHIRRFHNSAFLAGSWRQGGVEIVETSEGKFESRGPVNIANPVWYWFSRLWNASSLVHLVNVDLPLLSQSRIDQFVRGIVALRNRYHQETDVTNPFVVVILPYGFDPRPLRLALEQNEIHFIDYSRNPLFTRLQGPEFLPGEIHPTPEAHRMLATVIKRDLAKIGNL